MPLFAFKRGLMMNFFSFLLLLSLLMLSPLHAQVEKVTIRWTAMLCQGSCPRLLEKEFRKINGVKEIAMDQGGGQLTLTWKEKVPFQFTSVNTAMHMVGLSIRDIRIRVKGFVKHTGDTFYIVSEGDNTRFDLLNPVIPHPGGQASEFNASTRKLTPALRQQLLLSETEKQIATVEGPVFMPERMTVPTQIVIDQLSFSAPEEEKSR